ncbi:helix-turn-helix transcriptional regulator [Candidatus Dojkabacteria bacterium]|nr:helix-turn-helix transcriptional regulator [Candidatus Dojkabacteria bacterium]
MKVSTTERIKNLQKLLVTNRIKILSLLAQKDTCVCQIVKQLKLKHNLISHHLKTLVDMKYIESKRNGQHIIYRLVNSQKKGILSLLSFINN